ncbi:hypothetical protein PanWU01x14_142930 [Parasponia andersonii]|uniref:Uncharacterized protein n=1 Tax=Parasponia andersonii TaxID=3476 RepID=A0A2P5CLK8_PARAD|nr:hypothetical protein PanWU01x14_142930 [Parasponia andersonii]
MYLTATRFDMMHDVNLISRYIECPREMHLLDAKRIFRYLQGTTSYGLFYKKGKRSEIYFALQTVIMLKIKMIEKAHQVMFSCLVQELFRCHQRSEHIVTLLTIEAEFITTTTCACQGVCLRNFLEELYFKHERPTLIYCNNNSGIKPSKNLVLHGRSKHIDMKYHFLKNLCNDRILDLNYCKSKDQLADIMTKPLKLATFSRLRKLLGVYTIEHSLQERETHEMFLSRGRVVMLTKFLGLF